MPSPNKALGVGAGAVLAIAAGLITHWEGVRYTPYRDLNNIWTVCYGSTRGIEQRPYSRVECEQKLKDELADHLAGLVECIHKPLRMNEWAALGSWGYNVGVTAACKSTLVRKINAGDSASEWCKELLRWDFVGGRKVRGLTLRRQDEYRVCTQ